MTTDKNILIKNIYYMLAYAYDTLTPSVYEDMQTEQFDHIYDMYAHVLTRRLCIQRRKGLHKTYQSHLEELASVKGKLNIPGTIHSRMQRRCTVICAVDELTENNLLNQILKTALLFLLQHPKVSRKYKLALKRELMYFSEVDRILPQMISWNLLPFQRISRNYRLMLAVCRMLLEGLLLTTESGSRSLFTFHEVRDLSVMEEKERSKKLAELFEKFVRRYYGTEYGKFSGFSSEDEIMRWQEDNAFTRHLPKMHTDITLTYGHKVLIIDTKYYQRTLEKNNYSGNTFISPDNLYQIFAYVKNKEIALEKRTGPKDPPYQVSGMLLYAATTEAEQPDDAYSFGGTKISVRTLNLNTDFENIRRRLDEIAFSCFGLNRSARM